MKDYFILVVLLLCERTVKDLDVGDARVIIYKWGHVSHFEET